MQTFLPYADFTLSLSILDLRRLGKQRVEAQQILAAVEGKTEGWKHHPIVRAWRNHPLALEQYLRIAIEEFSRRGGNNFMVPPETKPYKHMLPGWFGDERFHSSHRAALLAKDFKYYSKFNWTEDPVIDYLWP